MKTLTIKQRKALTRMMIDLVNSYEVKQRKFLKGIAEGHDFLRYSGHAHNYTVHLSQIV